LEENVQYQEEKNNIQQNRRIFGGKFHLLSGFILLKIVLHEAVALYVIQIIIIYVYTR